MKNSIFLITIDCLRSDYVTEEVMPFLKSLADQGTMCMHFFSNAPFTAPTMPAILNSQYPLDHPNCFPLPEQETNIARVFQKKGYTTIGFTTSIYLTKYFHCNYGFEHFFDVMKIKKTSIYHLKHTIASLLWKWEWLYNLAEKIYFRFIHKKIKKKVKIPYTKGEKVIQDNLAFLEKYDEKNKIFNWIHFMDAHSPRNPPEAYLKKFKGTLGKEGEQKSVEEDIRWYKASLHYIDNLLKQYMTRIQQKFPEAVFFITADHGEAFNEHKGIRSHASYLYNELLKVPGILVGKDIAQRKISFLCSSVDIAPTLWNIAGISFQDQKIRGQNILTKKEDKPLIAESIHTKNRGATINATSMDEERKGATATYKIYAVQDKKRKIIYDKINNRFEYYDLMKDPGEQQCLKYSDTFKELKKIIDDRREKRIEKKKEEDRIQEAIADLDL